MTTVVSIAGQPINTPTLNVLVSSLSVHDALDQRSTCTFAVRDETGVNHYQLGQPVTVTDTFAVTPLNPTGLIFTGYINDSSELELIPNADIVSTISCIDQHYLADKRVAQTDYTGWFAGDIVSDLLARYLSQEGVVATYALRRDSTASDFTQGTLSKVIGALNVGDGNLELAPAGSTVSIVENTTTVFGAGSLTNVTASNNQLKMAGTPTIKLQGTAVVPGADLYVYRQIWSGSLSISANDTLTYDLWIAATSPEIKCGVDFLCSDGTTLRGHTLTYAYDQQGLLPDPSTDLKGLADSQWYSRTITIPSGSPLIGKTITAFAVASDGDNLGTYTAYFKNIIWNHSGTHTIFSSTLNTNPTVELQNNGYLNTSVSVVTSYLQTGQRVSAAYPIGPAVLVKQSNVRWNATTPIGTSFLLETSLDNGATYQACTDYQAVPNLLAGMRVGPARTLQVRETLSLTGDDPTVSPLLSAISITVVSAPTANTTDAVNTTSNFSSGTLTNLTGGAGSLKLTGSQRNWVNGSSDLASQTVYGSGSTMRVVNRQLQVSGANGVDTYVSLDFAGSLQNFTAEVDINLANDLEEYGLVYRSGHLSNNQFSYAYTAYVAADQITLKKGTNSSAGGTGTALHGVTIALSTGTVHRLKVVVNGSSHSLYLDGFLYFTFTDSSYTSTGSIGLRYYNGTGSSSSTVFDDFGIMPITGTLSGTRVASAVSINPVVAVGNSIIMWNATIPDTTSILVESSLNGGSSWSTCLNGGQIPGLGMNAIATGKSLTVRVTLTSSNTTIAAQLTGLTWWVVGEYFATGLRVGLPLSVSPVGRAGATLVSWNALVPVGTTLNVDTSLDGNTWTNIGGGAQGSAPIAGIVSQIDPIEDTFTKLSSSFYTSTSQSGGQVGTWVWDTNNSRVIARGGNNAFLLYSGLIAQDIDLLADMDEADSCGLVWRQVDSRNFYEALVQDASSPSPNQLVLNKITGGVRAPIATASLSFARGTPHRLRVTMFGNVITIYFDGVQLLTYTDLHPLGAGLTGLCNDTILGSGLGRFYRFRVQPQGDSVVGKNVFTRVRMTSTDPTVTPQLSDITTSVHGPNIQNGAFIPSTTYSVLNGSTNTIASDLDDLAKQSNYWWRIFNFQMYFQARNGILSPWIVTGDDIKRGQGSTQVETISDLYRNSSWILGGTDTQLVSQLFTADGIAQSWNMDFPVDSLQSVTVDNNVTAFGVQGVDTGKQIYYTVGNNTITQDITQVPYLTGQKLVFQYNARTHVAVNAQSAAQIAARAASDGTSGIIEMAETASGLNRDAATHLAQSRIVQYGINGQTLQFPVMRPGLSVGQLASVFWERYGIVDGEYLIVSMDTKWITTNVNGKAEDQPVYTISGTSGPIVYNWMTYQAGLHR